MRQISTIGYEGASLDDFVGTLCLSGVTILLDVRERPMSRRRGFAKNALRMALENAGIRYVHDSRLGSPKPIRDELKYGGWNYAKFFREYEAHLADHQHLVETLAEELDGHVALMCYERNPQVCHRSAVANAFERVTGLKPQHLGVQPDEQREAIDSSRADSCKGVSTA